ncbi:MAG TPA: lytic transglycosylase domain-containing protein [Puia sp.]|nr:lytic transglycosylase domain-containing protein [Puia sp.]
MLKSSIPVYLCSSASVIIILSASIPHYSPPKPAGTTASVSPGNTEAVVKIARISFAAPNKQGLKFVHMYIKSNDQCLVDVKQRSIVPFTIIDSIFNRYRLPLELKYVAVVESELKPTAVSRVGAKGPWQLMPATAHILGLKVNRHADERINYYKSTKAAAKYLRDLHAEFKDWLLVLAAYNGGSQAVHKAIHLSHSRDFWTIQGRLPAESRDYVKKFIATAYYFEGAGNKPVVATKKTPPARDLPVATKRALESTDEKFRRLMKESANSLQKSNELLDPHAIVANMPAR